MKSINKKQLTNCIKIFLVSVFFFSCNSEKLVEKKIDNVKYVDPQIGGVAPFLQPTRTRIHLPNSMVRMYPERDDYRDDQITSFPLTTRKHRSDLLFNIMPVSGDLPENEAPISAWDQELEIAHPYYFSTWLEDYDITVEFTPAAQAGFFRFNYQNDETRKLYLRNLSGDNWLLNSDGSLTGSEIFEGMKAYVYAKIDSLNITSKGIIKRDTINSWISWGNNKPKKIQFKYGLSFISVDQAKKNLEREIPDFDFDKLKNKAYQAWSKVMNQIEVEGGTEAYKRTFYTALYRSYERMINITEDGKYYSNYDKKIHEGEQDFYADDWVWDTFLALHPLRYILQPEMESDMMASYVRMYEQSGWLPQFPQIHGDAPPMNGFHSTIMLLDAYRKGVHNFDTEVAFQAMKKNAIEGSMIPWSMGEHAPLDKLALELGYFPALHPGEKETDSKVHDFEKRQAVVVTLAQGYDDWALAEFAKELGKEDDYKYFSKTAQNYKNLYWKEKGFFMPKDAKGNWIDIDPKFDGGMGGRDYYDENNGWTYLWNVQQDILGLQELMGGRKTFEERLDQMFREDLGRSTYALNARFPDFTGIVGQYSMGNEPSFHIPYLYNFTDSPWKAQKKIRMLLNTWFKDNIFGIPGDEDGGGMSAFVVFSAMGFYPITPGIPVYTIGSPLFSKISIKLPNGKKFTINALNCNETNKYIQSATLNGKELKGPWFTHQDLINGATITLEMGKYPNKNWGADQSLIPHNFKN
ncbi:GH92 family glycosyl hydrolase [Polaribacter sp.]|jgi:predicted alpha-1,2-mannosidase|uniref:GH92 family glycosyl hydrolase n=1 Tax=Polaribacter sp. TaxID=1920175 RepID=UPI004047F971